MIQCSSAANTRRGDARKLRHQRRARSTTPGSFLSKVLGRSALNVPRASLRNFLFRRVVYYRKGRGNVASCVSRAARLPRNSRDCQDVSRVHRDKKERSSNRASSSDSPTLENHRREEENHLAARESPREINCTGLVVVCYRGI